MWKAFIINFIYVICFLSFSISSFSQNVYNGFLSDFYLGRQPSAKAEAMGRGLIAYPEYEFSSWYNPATVSLSDKITVNGAYSYPYYSYTNAFYNYACVSFNTYKYGAIGFSRYYLDESSPKNTLYTLNYAFQIIESFYAGINFNIVSFKFFSAFPEGDERNLLHDLYPIDIGLLKVFQVQKSNHTNQIFTLGSAIYNFTNTKSNALDIIHSDPLTVIFRIGAGYNLQYKKRKEKDALNTLNLFVYSEAEDLLNSKYNSVFKIGAEVTSFEIFSARIGFYSQNTGHYDYSYVEPESRKLTFGFGLQAPVSKITKGEVPMKIRLDYTNLPQVVNKPGRIYNNFQCFSVAVSWDKKF